MFMWHIIISLLGVVFGPLLLPTASTVQTSAAATIAAASFPWSSNNTICYSLADIPEALSTDQKAWSWRFFLAGFLLALLAVRLLLEPRTRNAIKSWTQSCKRLASLGCDIWAVSLEIATEWHTVARRICHDHLVVSPALSEEVLRLQTKISALEKDLAACRNDIQYYENVYPATISALNNTSEARTRSWKEVDDLKQEIQELKFANKVLEEDQDARLIERERYAFKDKINKLEEKCEHDGRTIRQKDQQIKHHEKLQREAEADRDVKAQELTNALIELKNVNDSLVQLRFDPRYSGAMLRDAREFGIIRDAIHDCAETQGDMRIVAVGFAMAVEKLGGNLQALGIDQRRYQDLKTFVMGGQNPQSVIQPVGFR